MSEPRRFFTSGMRGRAKTSRRARRQVAVFYPFVSKRMLCAAKRNAAAVVKDALRTGALTRKPCEVCGRKRRTEAHHDDYDKPLDVHFLCRYHHRLRDAALREERLRLQKMAEAIAPTPTEPQAPVEPVAEPIADRIRRVNRKHIGAGEHAALLVRDVTVLVAEAMDERRVTENALSERLGSSRQYVNTLFAGGIRTLKSLSAVAAVLGYRIEIRLIHNDETVAEASRVA